MRNFWIIALVSMLIICTSAIAEEKDSDIVAMTILGEARGEGYAGMYAVACVLKQRSINRKLSPRQVCLQSRLVKGVRIHQFSCWNYTSLTQYSRNRAKLKKLLDSNTQQSNWAKAMAKHLMQLETNYIKQADHYCTLNTHNYWTRISDPVKTIGNHKFFKLIP
jgi:spore germination cell wall hydrolase CwlJ-like protein